MPSEPAPLVASAVADTPAAPTHPCVRCGRPTAIDRGLCEECNPLGLRDAASSQVHGIALVGVLVAVVILALLGRVAISGIGPFDASVRDVEPAAAGLSVTLDVTNRGSSAGQTTCQISDPSPAGTAAVAVVQSPRIDPGETRSFTSEITQFGREPIQLTVACGTL